MVHVDVSDPSQQFTHPESSISVSPQYTLLSPANLGGEGEGVCSLPESRTVASVWRTVCPEVEKISFRKKFFALKGEQVQGGEPTSCLRSTLSWEVFLCKRGKRREGENPHPVRAARYPGTGKFFPQKGEEVRGGEVRRVFGKFVVIFE